MGIHPLVDDILIFPSHYLLFRDCSNLASMDYTRMTRIVSLYIRIYMYIHKCVYIYIYIYISEVWGCRNRDIVSFRATIDVLM